MSRWVVRAGKTVAARRHELVLTESESATLRTLSKRSGMSQGEIVGMLLDEVKLEQLGRRRAAELSGIDWAKLTPASRQLWMTRSPQEIADALNWSEKTLEALKPVEEALRRKKEGGSG